jgi:amino-acid N-acetyltransferase
MGVEADTKGGACGFGFAWSIALRLHTHARAGIIILLSLGEMILTPTVRKARMTDVEAVHALINAYAQQGLMLARSRKMLYEGLREFSVVEEDGQVVGVGGLHIVWQDLAEIRALAVGPGYTRNGVGKQIVSALLAEAKELAIPRVFALTYQPVFFERCGFVQVDKDALPQKVWKECINCPQFPNCNESAMVFTV